MRRFLWKWIRITPAYAIKITPTTCLQIMFRLYVEAPRRSTVIQTTIFSNIAHFICKSDKKYPYLKQTVKTHCNALNGNNASSVSWLTEASSGRIAYLMIQLYFVHWKHKLNLNMLLKRISRAKWLNIDFYAIFKRGGEYNSVSWLQYYVCELLNTFW